MSWVRVEDRLPEHGTDILAWGKSIKKVTPCWYSSSSETWYLDDDEILDLIGVTHWMPLPKPPE